MIVRLAVVGRLYATKRHFATIAAIIGVELRCVALSRDGGACDLTTTGCRINSSSPQQKGGDPVSHHQPRSTAAVTRIPALAEILA
jgi:hypothetical protein